MFITFEGIDGSGKSTAMQAVAAALEERGPVWCTREETDYLGPAVRRSISEKADPLVTTYLFTGDRFHHAPEIRRHLLDGETVLCDRYMHSTMAYQGVTVGEDDWLRSLHAHMPKPDRVLWFDVPADVAVARAQGRGETAPYEKAEFLEKVRAKYAELAAAEPELFVRIDATMAPGEVAAAALAAIELNSWRASSPSWACS